jgi:hypothetical protein
MSARMGEVTLEDFNVVLRMYLMAWLHSSGAGRREIRRQTREHLALMRRYIARHREQTNDQ